MDEPNGALSAERRAAQLAYRRRIWQGEAATLTDAELAFVAAEELAPALPSAACDWAERIAEPLLVELGKRLEARREVILREWLETTFRAALQDDERIKQAAALVAVGVRAGDSSCEVARTFIAYFVRELVDPGATDRDTQARLQAESQEAE